MLTILLLVFIACLIYNYYDVTGNFVFFSRIVETVNSIREKTPREVKNTRHSMIHEYKCGGRLYGIMIPKRQQLNWTTVAVCRDGVWSDATKVFEYWAGPYKDFYGIPLKPHHIDDSCEMIGFAFPKNIVVHVKSTEMIILKLRQALNSSK